MCERMFQFYVSKITREKKQQPIAEGAPNQTIGKLKKAKRLTQSKNVYELAKFGILNLLIRVLLMFYSIPPQLHESHIAGKVLLFCLP